MLKCSETEETGQENRQMVEVMKQRHFVLVHGACHGAWCWYKLKPRLEAAGHRVTTLDLAASGINRKAIEDVHSFHEYSEPLLEILASLPHDEKVVLVGHSLGGLNLALAMDKFPEKVSVAVFLTAFMPDTTHPPSYVLDQFVERTPAEGWLDSQFVPYGDSDPPLTTMFFGPEFFSSKLYQLSTVEDLELAKALARPGSLFLVDLAKAKKFSNEGYGAVTRVYVLCDEDKAITLEFQRWMIQNSPVQDVLEIKGSDHMSMYSKTQELCDCLVEIAQKHS